MDHHKKVCDAGKTIGCGMSSLSDGFCTICFGKIAPQETALVKGCKHAYCVKCIPKWVTEEEEDDLEETEASLEDIEAGPSFGRKNELARNLNRKQSRIALKRQAAEMEAAAKYLLRFNR